MVDRKEALNIALIDLNHMTLGVHTNTVPLGIGLIADYIKHSITHAFDIRLFKNPYRFLDALKKWSPDVLGISQYSWNSELNLYMAQLVKKNNSDCVIVAGGPNLPLSPEEKRGYLKERNFIDLCVSYDGEIPFTEIVKRFIEGENIEEIKRSPAAGTYSIEPVSGKLIESKEPAPRLNSLDVFQSIYAEGFFDKFLDDDFHPFVQTQRGCPYSCTYCHTGNRYYSKIAFQSLENFRKDIEYLGERYAGQHNTVLYMANTNFGLYKEDFKIAQVIRAIQDKYDWPKRIDVNSSNKPENLLKLLSIFKYKFRPAIALQTLTPKVLKNIKRKNIPFEGFVDFQKYATQNIDEKTETELILSLPEETKQSFLDTVSRVLNSGVRNIVIYTLMSLKGTPISSRDTVRRYGHEIKHRIVPRCFTELDGAKIFDTEEVVIGTRAMPFTDYMDLRGLALLITVFASSIELYPIRKFLLERKLNIAAWIFGIQGRIADYPRLLSAYKSFLQETKDELFPSRRSLLDFFNEQENYDLLYEGNLGDNLLRKYKTVFLSRHYRACLEIAFSELRLLAKRLPDMKLNDSLLKDLESYLQSRDVGHVFRKGYDEDILQTKKMILLYDIPRWLADRNENLPLEKYKGRFIYSLVITDYMKEQLRDFDKTNRNPELSLQILYRDGYIEDFWPLWICDKEETTYARMRSG